MPGKNNASAAKGKGMNRKNQYADNANKKVLADMVAEGVDEHSTRFGRATKIVGNSRVLVDLSDGRTTNALIRNVLRGRQATPIRVGTLLLIGLPNWEKEAGIEATLGKTVEPEAYVEAVLDKKTAKHFVSLKLIPPAFLVEGEGSEEEDAGFEFGSDDEEEEKPTAKRMPKEEKAEEEEEEEEKEEEKSKPAENVVVEKWSGQRGKAVAVDSGFDFFSS